jgi:uncharacterized lipoprotein YmbA
MRPTLPTFALALLGLLSFSACNIIPEAKPDPTRYYTLSLPAAIEASVPANAKALRLGLRQVELSPYLKKGLLVVRTSDTEVRYDDYERWAEPLDTAVSRMLQTCLQSDPRIGKVSVAPLSAEDERDFDIIVRVRRADGLRQASGSSVRFVAIVEIHSTGAGSELLGQKAFTAPEIAWDGRDFNALSQALSRSVQLLAGEIASMIPVTGAKATAAAATP